MVAVPWNGLGDPWPWENGSGFDASVKTSHNTAASTINQGLFQLQRFASLLAGGIPLLPGTD